MYKIFYQSLIFTLILINGDIEAWSLQSLVKNIIEKINPRFPTVCRLSHPVIVGNIEEVRRLLSADPTINVNEIPWLNSRAARIWGAEPLLVSAARWGHDDIVDLLCEYGADPLIQNTNELGYKNAFDVAIDKIKLNYDLYKRWKNQRHLQEIERYKRIVWLLRAQVKVRYGIPLLAMTKAGPIIKKAHNKSQKSAEIKEGINKLLLPMLLGPQVVNLKPVNGWPKEEPPFITRRRMKLTQVKEEVVAPIPVVPRKAIDGQELPPGWYYEPVPQHSFMNKKIIALSAVGTLAATYTIYRYVKAKKEEPREEPPIVYLPPTHYPVRGSSKPAMAIK